MDILLARLCGCTTNFKDGPSWKGPPNQRKGQVVVDVRSLNSVTLPDAYPLPLQADIIHAVSNCK